MSDTYRTNPLERSNRPGRKIVFLLALFTLLAFWGTSPVSAVQRMVLAEGYTNYQ